VNATYNPIVEVRELPRLRFSVRDLRAKAHTVLVLVSATGEPLAIHPGHPVPHARTGSYREAYFIDVAEHQLQMECRLPSKDGAFHFSAHVSYRCQVADPALVVANRCTDSASVVEPVLRRTLRLVTRRHEPDDVAEAEREVYNVLFGRLPDVPGFQLSDCAVELSLDGDEATYVRKKRVARHRHELDKGELAVIKPLVQEGDDGMIALYLTRHPDDAAAVVDLLRAHDHATGEQRLEALRVMFSKRGPDDDFDMERVRHSIAATIAEELRPSASRPALSRGRLRGSLLGGTSEKASDDPGPADGGWSPAARRDVAEPPRNPDADD
jgi:hypothetical protein